MTFEEAMGNTVTNKQARQEVARHGARWEDFVLDHGEHATYAGRIVLIWLGY